MNKEYKKPKQFRAYLALAWYALKAQTRNPATFAFGFIFPIVFISIFGLIGGSDPKITLGIPNDQTNQQHPLQECPHHRMKSRAAYQTGYIHADPG